MTAPAPGNVITFPRAGGEKLLLFPGPGQRVFPPRCLLTLFRLFFFSAPSALGLVATAGHILFGVIKHVCVCVFCDMMREWQQRIPLQQSLCPSRLAPARATAAGGWGRGGPQDSRSKAEQVELENGEHPALSPAIKEAVRLLSFSSWSENQQLAQAEAAGLRFGPGIFWASWASAPVLERETGRAGASDV